MLRPLSVLILLTLMTVLTTLDAAAQSDPIAPTQFTSWTAWTSRTPEGNFALDRCKTLQAGDINGDGLTDLVCPYDYGSASTATFVQISDGESFTSWTTWAPRTPEGNFALDRCKTLQTGDLNGDGLTDLVCPYDYGSASTATFVQISDGESFTSWTAWAPRTPEGNFALDRCKTLQTGDLNGDGLTDLVCPYDYGSASTATFVQLSDGESFTGWTAWASRTPEGNFALDRCRALQTGDLNDDGLTDLVCPYDYGSASTATFVQLSDGESFASWTAWAARTTRGFSLSTAARRCKPATSTTTASPISSVPTTTAAPVPPLSSSSPMAGPLAAGPPGRHERLKAILPLTAVRRCRLATLTTTASPISSAPTTTAAPAPPLLSSSPMASPSPAGPPGRHGRLKAILPLTAARR